MPGRMLSNLESIKNVEQVVSEDSYDLIIAGHSIESRSKIIPIALQESHAIKIAYMGCNEKNYPDQSDHGFTVCQFHENEFRTILNSLSEKKSCDGDKIKILIDITSLARRIIASVIGEIIGSITDKNIDLSIFYTLAAYNPPSEDAIPGNKKIEPVHPEFAGWTSNPDFPAALIVGLGYERDKALGVIEYLEASKRFLFLPNSPETDFRPQVEMHNKQLLDQTEQSQQIDYEVINPLGTLLTLGSLISGLKNQAKPVLLPFGPKILFALALLAAIVHTESSVWYVSGEEDELPVDRKPSAHSFGLRCLIMPKKQDA